MNNKFTSKPNFKSSSRFLKKTISIKLLCFLLFNNVLLFAQTSTDIMWTKTYGGNSIDEIQSIKQTTDGGYIVAGYTGSKGNGGLDVWLMKIDENGNEIWDKTFGGLYEEKANFVQQTSDGGFIITGYTASYGNGAWDVWLIKTDENGNEEWNKTFGGSSWDIGYSVIQTNDGGYIIGGNNYSNSNQNLSDGWIIKTDSEGNMEWDKIYGGNGDDFIFGLQHTSDDKYIFTGSSDPQITQSNFRDLWLLKTDANGNSEWSKTFDGNNNKDFGHEVQETSDGGFIITGNKRHAATGKREIWLIKTDSDGNEEWNKVLSDGKDALSRSIQPTTDGGYIISGFIDIYNTGDMDFCLIKIDNNYDRQWLKNFGENNQYEEAFSAQETTDGGYIIAGFTTISTNNPDYFIVKTDEEGNITNNSSVGINELSNISLTNHPNPFVNNTTITFCLEKQSRIKLSVYNSLGQLVNVLEDNIKTVGNYSYKFQVDSETSGIYFYCLEIDDKKITKKMMVL